MGLDAMRKIVLTLLAGAVLEMALQRVEAQNRASTLKPRYSIVNIGDLSAVPDDIAPGLNAQGEVVGWEASLIGAKKGFLWSKGKATYLGALPNFPDTFAVSLNAGGEVVGIVKSPADARFSRAFRWKAGLLSDLGTLGGEFSTARAINDKGWIVGSAQNAQKGYHAVVWRGGEAQDLGTLPNGDSSMAQHLNQKGEIVGAGNTAPNGKPHAILWKEGKAIDLGMLPGGSLSNARSINDKGDIVGWADNAEGDLQAVWWRDGKIVNLGTLGDDPASAWSVNNAGQIVGTAANAKQRMNAFLWEKGVMFNLNELLPKDSGWLLQFAFRINDKGQILGQGRLKGEKRLFLLTPLQETGSNSLQKPRFCAQKQASKLPPRLALSQPAPNFTLNDMAGTPRSLSAFRGRPVALLFFCGCKWCVDYAKLWGEIQRSAALSSGGNMASPQTIVVFNGSAEELKGFMRLAQMDSAQTLFLVDKKMQTTLLYRALPCPRIHILDAKGVLRYRNDHPDDAPQKATAATLVSRTIDALQKTAPPPPPEEVNTEETRLTVLERNGVEKIQDRAGRFSFGGVDPLSHPILERVFVLKNEGIKPILISQLQSSCGCASAIIGKESGAKSAKVPPGGEIAISFTVRTAHLKPGSLSKYVYVYVGNDSVAAVSLEILATLRSVVSFSPPVVSFGTTKAGIAAQATVETRLDARFLTTKEPPVLKSSTPYIEVSPMGEAETEKGEGQSFVKRTYTLTLTSSAPIGSLQAQLYFASPSTSSKPEERSELPVPALGGVYTTVAANVEGKIVANPRVIVFGSTAFGQEIVREVVLTGETEEVLKGLKIRSSTPYLSVMQKSKTQGEKPTLVLEVKLSAKTPVGGNQEEITLETAEGQRLTLLALYNVFKL